MPTIRIDSFSGIMPRLHPTLLPDGCAVTAHNCRLKSGKLSPLRQPSQVGDMRIRLENGLDKIANAQTVYLWRRNGGVEEFMAWPDVVKIAPSNIADDTLRRIFVTGNTGIGDGKKEPCAYISTVSGAGFARHTLVKEKLPNLTTDGESPTLTLAEGSAADTDNLRYTFFFQTWVDAYGYESPVSDIDPDTDEVVYNDGDTVTAAAVNAPDGAVTRRVYKVVTGMQTESIQFIAEQAKIGVDFSEMTFTVKDEDAGEVLPRIVSPPSDLSWMTYMPGSFYAGFSPSTPRTVMFSDVNRPSSWPDDYCYDVRDDLVGLAVSGNTVYALTKGAPWVLTGTAPESMSAAVCSSPQACVSARSICVMAGAVFYASQDGVCMMSPNSDYAANVVVLTEKYFSKREWEELNPSSCIMDGYDGALFCWFTLAGGGRRGYVIDLREGAAAVTTHDEQAKASFYDVEDDALYYVREV